MTEYLTSSEQKLIPRSLMWTGTGLMAAGALLGLAGSGLYAAAGAIALGRHVRGSGLPPSDLAMQHWRRAKAAAKTGADHWRANTPMSMAAQMPTPRQPIQAPVG